MAWDRETAAVRVKEDLYLLRRQFETLPGLIDDIDTRNARYSGVALRKIMYLLRQDKRIEGQLQLIIDRIAKDEAPEIEFDVYRCSLLAEGFLYNPARRRPRAVSRKLARPPRADAAEIRRGVAPRLRRAYSRVRVEEYVERLLAGRRSVSIQEADLAGDGDYVRLIYVAAYGFDPHSKYTFERVKDGAGFRIERKGIYGFPAGDLKKKGKGGRDWTS